MLRELNAVRQIPGEMPRRWFSSGDMDLIVWFDAAGQPDHFELCFDKSSQERCLRWSGQKLAMYQIDSGEGEPGRHKGTPIHRACDAQATDHLLERFMAASDCLPTNVREFVAAALNKIL